MHFSCCYTMKSRVLGLDLLQTKRHLRLALISLFGVAVLAWAPPTRSTARDKLFSVDDLLRLEEINEVTLAPDGRALAFVRRFPRASSMTEDRCRVDVWITSLESATDPVNITNGEAEGRS